MINIMLKKILAWLMIISVLISFVGCSQERTETKMIHGLDGKEIEVPVEVNRLAAVYGPSYEAAVVLGVEDKVVVCADVQFENFPWARKVFKRINTLPYLENVHSGINFEELMKYNPHLVLAFPRPNEIQQLKKNNIAAIPGTTTGSLDDIKNQLMVYAEALGPEAVDMAKKYTEYFDEKVSMIKEVTSNIADKDRPKVYYAGMDMLTTYGKYSDLSELIYLAGGINVAKDLEGGNRTQINYEQLAAWNPEYIFIDHGAINEGDTAEMIMENTYSDGRYGVIEGVSKKQVYLTPSGVFYWDMGIQKILLLMMMAKTIHPDYFKNLNMIEELKYFYKTFFSYELTDEDAVKILNRQDP